MEEKASPPKAPRLIFSACEDIPVYRDKHGMTQSDFWLRVGVSQSCGSRYERGRRIPRPIRQLLHIAYGTPKQSTALVEWLRHNGT